MVPVLGASPASIASYFSSHRMQFLVGNYLGIAAMIPGLLALSYLSALFRRAEDNEGWSWLVVLSSGIFAFGVATADLVVFQAIPFLSAPGLELGAKVASDIAEAGFALAMLPVSGFALAVAWACRATNALPRWVAPSGIVTAAISFAASLGSIWTPPFLAGGGPVTSLALFVFACWFGAIGVALLRKR